MSDPTNSDDIIDSRDVIKRIEELRDERADLESNVERALENSDPEPDCEECDGTGAVANPSGPEGNRELACEACAERLREDIRDAKSALDEWDDENGAELKALEALQDEAEGYCDWTHGETLIRESYFETYAQELAEELAHPQWKRGEVSWPFTCIDWEQAARELQMDYSAVDFDGVTYYIRS